MARKNALLGGVQLKVENMSGFDKSRYNAFTAPLGAIVPMVKQLLLPGFAKLSVKVSATLPPLASDAFLRTHLKLEAFFVPLRLCYGGFQSWFAGERIYNTTYSSYRTAALPRLKCLGNYTDGSGVSHVVAAGAFDAVFGPHTLMDYFGVKYQMGSGMVTPPQWSNPTGSNYNYSLFNIFPFIAYQLCYDHWYRNKLIEQPCFCQSDFDQATNLYAAGPASQLPWISSSNIKDFVVDMTSSDPIGSIPLRNGRLLELRKRNYGYDYFTTALPSAQDGNPMSVNTSGGSFTISALRMQNALQEFAEKNQVCGPDYIQVCRARYGKAPSSQVVQRPVLLGSADFPMFTSGVEQSAPFDSSSTQTNNPFEGLGARFGRAHAEGSEFVCDVDADEPGYLMVMCSLVPDANYAMGVSHDMRMFTLAGSLVDLPCAELERTGMEPIMTEELAEDNYDIPSASRPVFGYQPRYMWHKAGQVNEVHGLFRKGASLESFIPQRSGYNGNQFSQINTNFLKVQPTDLDNIMAVSGSLSQYGVMIDSAISLFVSEPLGESVMPSLVDPAAEHGHSVYVKRGGLNVDN